MKTFYVYPKKTEENSFEYYHPTRITLFITTPKFKKITIGYNKFGYYLVKIFNLLLPLPGRIFVMSTLCWNIVLIIAAIHIHICKIQPPALSFRLIVLAAGQV